MNRDEECKYLAQSAIRSIVEVAAMSEPAGDVSVSIAATVAWLVRCVAALEAKEAGDERRG